MNDRGPYHGHRLIDMSVQAAKLLGFYEQGLAQVRVEYLGRAELEGSDNDRLAATLRHEDQSAVQLASNAPVRPDTSNPSPINRELMQPQCARQLLGTIYPQPVNFNANAAEDVNCKPALSGAKIALSFLLAFKQKSCCAADHAPIDEHPSRLIIPH